MGTRLILKRKATTGEYEVIFGRRVLGKFVGEGQGMWYIPKNDTVYDFKLSSYQLRLLAEELERLED